MKRGRNIVCALTLASSVVCCLLSVGCSDDRSRNRELVGQWLGREIVMPDELVYQIQNDTVKLDLERPDFKIVNYVDSSGCTSCRMKLSRWSEVIDELKSIPDIDVEVITIVNTDDHHEIAYLLRRDNYLNPVAFDGANTFDRVNELPSSPDYHTFLLDSENKVVAIGNPAANPKIKDVFMRHITEEQEAMTVAGLCDKPVRAIGVVRPGEAVIKSFYLLNRDTIAYTVQDIVPSCDCVDAVVEALPEKLSHKVTVTYTADSSAAPFCRYVDVFFNEIETPERLTVYGYIK